MFIELGHGVTEGLRSCPGKVSPLHNGEVGPVLVVYTGEFWHASAVFCESHQDRVMQLPHGGIAGGLFSDVVPGDRFDG